MVRIITPLQEPGCRLCLNRHPSQSYLHPALTPHPQYALPTLTSPEFEKVQYLVIGYWGSSFSYPEWWGSQQGLPTPDTLEATSRPGSVAQVGAVRSAELS